MPDAPARLWALVDPVLAGSETISGLISTGALGTFTEAEVARSAAAQRDEAFNRTRDDRRHQAVQYVRLDVVAALVRGAFEHLDHVPGLVYSQGVGDLKTAILYLHERLDEVATPGAKNDRPHGQNGGPR